VQAGQIIHLSTRQQSTEELLGCEWLLTNERGSYASSTVLGCNTSSYHGLLIGSLDPPVSRIMALSNCLETLTCGQKVFELSAFEFANGSAPTGSHCLRRFHRDTGAHFLYDLEAIQVERAVYLVRKADAVVVEYVFRGIDTPVDFAVRPFVGLRDFHCQQRSCACFVCEPVRSGVLVHHEQPGSGELVMNSPNMRFEADPQWWFNFTYRVNRQRGQHATEDLWTPGLFKRRLECDGRIVFWARLDRQSPRDGTMEIDVDAVKQDLARYQEAVVSKAEAEDETDAILALAADQFIVRRCHKGVEGSTIVAGYPWFADWGRDAFIALPGLLLATGRCEEAKSVLSTFASVVDAGMVPNRFDDRCGPAHFNSVDASLWFINAAFQYLRVTADTKTFLDRMLPAIAWIIDSYQNGTRFSIHSDTDGLITAGDSDTQLTWMDARYEGVSFTPRWGKAVEVNALWHNALCHLREFWVGRDATQARRYGAMAQKAAKSFSRLFWNDQSQYLNDTVMPDGRVDASLRPNQIFAVSLPFGPPLNRARQRAVVDAVERELLTPYGLRTLEVGDPSYRGRYEGPQTLRDAAYHQGTVWPYLMGPFVEAYLKVRDFSPQACARAREMMVPLLGHLLGDGCLGSISEIFDGDEPQMPRGCCAQAWSVGELIRIRRLLSSGHAGRGHD
jgi:predicted glycogen debranching enzyme